MLRGHRRHLALVVLGAHSAQLVRVRLLRSWLVGARKRVGCSLAVPVLVSADGHEVVVLWLLESPMVSHLILAGAGDASLVRQQHAAAALSFLVRAHSLPDVLRVVPLHVLVVDLRLRNFLICALIAGMSGGLALALIRNDLCLYVLIVPQRRDG